MKSPQEMVEDVMEQILPGNTLAQTYNEVRDTSPALRDASATTARAKIAALCEELGATAYAMGRRDERKAAEEDLHTKIAAAVDAGRESGRSQGEQWTCAAIAEWLQLKAQACRDIQGNDLYAKNLEELAAKIEDDRWLDEVRTFQSGIDPAVPLPVDVS